MGQGPWTLRCIHLDSVSIPDTAAVLHVMMLWHARLGSPDEQDHIVKARQDIECKRSWMFVEENIVASIRRQVITV